MALHTFESGITLAQRQFEGIVGHFEGFGNTLPLTYESITPTFQLEERGYRLGEIMLTHATDDEFAGTLYVGDSDKDQRNYDKLLTSGGVDDDETIPVCSFHSHLVAGTRLGSSENEFRLISVVSDGLQSKNQVRAERKFNELVRPVQATFFQINPKDIYGLARLLKPKTK